MFDIIPLKILLTSIDIPGQENIITTTTNKIFDFLWSFPFGRAIVIIMSLITLCIMIIALIEDKPRENDSEKNDEDDLM